MHSIQGEKNWCCHHGSIIGAEQLQSVDFELVKSWWATAYMKPTVHEGCVKLKYC